MANYWLLSAGKDGELWPAFWIEKKIAVGWSAVGDLRSYQTRNALSSAVGNTWPQWKAGAVRSSTTQLWQFYDGIKKDDLVFVRSYAALIGIALVVGDYDFLPPTHALRSKFYSPFFGDDYPHVRDIRWISLGGGMKQALALTRLTVMG